MSRISVLRLCDWPTNTHEHPQNWLSTILLTTRGHSQLYSAIFPLNHSYITLKQIPKLQVELKIIKKLSALSKSESVKIY